MNNVYREATMKKNVEKVVRLRGIAEANGVAIEAGIATGIDTIGDIGKFVSIRSDGSLACEDYNFEEKNPQMIKKINGWGRILRIGLLILASVSMVSYVVGDAKNNVGFSLAYIFFGLAFVSDAVVIALGRLLGVKEIVTFSKFLTAKNTVLNFYNDYKCIPNESVVREAERSDRGNEFDFIEFAPFASTLIVLGVARLFSGAIFAVVAIFWALGCITQKIALSQKILQYIFVISEPDEIHYQAAIQALKEALKWMENVTVKVNQTQLSKEDFIAKIGHIFNEEKCEKCEHFKECKEIWDNLDDANSEIYVREVRIINEKEKE